MVDSRPTRNAQSGTMMRTTYRAKRFALLILCIGIVVSGLTAPRTGNRSRSATRPESDREERTEREARPGPSITMTTETVGRQADGRVIVPTNQVLTPAGVQVEFPGRPLDAILSHDGRRLFVSNKDDVAVLDVKTSRPRITQIIPSRYTSFHGLAMAPDGQRVYASLSKPGIAVLQTT